MFFVRNEAAIVLDYYKWSPETVEEKTAYLVAKEKWEEIAKEKELSEPILITFLNDKEPEIRRNVIVAVGKRKIKDKKATKTLFEMLKHDENYDIREKAAEALSKIGTNESFEFLKIAAESEFWYSRKCVASAVKYLNDYEKALKLLKNLIKDENVYVRKAAKVSTQELLKRVRKEKENL